MTPDPPHLGPRLQKIRKTKRLTLDALAARSGVSRSMLSQIERAEANPTFSTLWNLTRALGVDLSDLVKGHNDGRASPINLLPAHFTPEIRTADGSCLLRILSPAANAGGFEWYELVVRPAGALVSDPHPAGAMEHLTVLEGVIEVQSGDENTLVSAGATARYAADLPHALRNLGETTARAILVVLS